MRLKKLELIGFKSFSDRTEIAFDEGVTCVVGPNGCGKSNISDAIRWVLGERSAKLLRGSRMEDVIFNGTDFRKPLAMAEVSLTIDNTDRGLPIDYQEVTLTRRLYRSGESEYLINKTLCRLKDIQDLILDTGIGSNSYSMIEQGRIDYILNADAEERRFLIEEAAGISKYKVKKEEAIRKLERTEENLLRLKDIVHEVHKNIQYAERQARRAERYKEQWQTLKDLEIRKAFYDLAQLAKSRESIEAERSACESELKALEAWQTECAQKQGEAASGLNHLHEQLSEHESKRYELRSKMEQNEQRLRFHQEKRVEFASRQGQIQQEKKEIEDRRDKNQTELAQKEKEVQELDLQKEKDFSVLNIAQERLAASQKEIDEAKSFWDQKTQEGFQRAVETTQIRNEYHRLLAHLESGDERKRRHEAGAHRLQKEEEEWHAKKEACAREIVTLEDKLARLNREQKEGREIARPLKERQAELERVADETKKLFHEKQARLQMLQELDASVGVNHETLLRELQDFEKSFFKTTREIFTVREGYEWALEAALGAFARSLVAEDVSSAEKILTKIREKKPNSVGLLIRDRARPQVRQMEKPDHPLIRHAVQEVVQIQPGYENIFHPFFHNVFIVESLDPSTLNELLPLAESCQLITQEGIVLGPAGRIFFRQQGSSNEGGFLSRGFEMETLQKEIIQCQSSLDQTHGELKRLTEEFGAAERQLEILESEILDARIQKESYDQLRRGMEDRLASFKRELQLLDFEAQEFSNSQEQAKIKKERLENELASFEEKEKEVRREQETLLKYREGLDRKKELVLQEVAELRARFENLEDHGRLMKDSLNLLRAQGRRDSERFESLGKEAEDLIEKEVRLGEEDEKIRGELGQWKNVLHDLDVTLELMRQEKEKAEKRAAALNQALQELREKNRGLQERLHQAEMKVMDLNYQEKGTLERFRQAYQINLTELKAEDFPLEDAKLEEVTADIQQLRGRLETLGTVNLLAIDEYEELKQRYDFLKNQQEDLEKAREELMEAIRKINRTTKGLFEETFSNIQKTFQEYYQVLFRGGEARLVLVDESNPLESGVDIVVRPPGKKLQPITLLSGGEKAMTAIALLFALFKIKPSPFCVLDEVDAPLDEANIDRFLTVLRTFLESSQFIITTHNRKTIAMGDSLYGVTMEEAGVSKIVSVKMNAPVEDTVTA